MKQFLTVLRFELDNYLKKKSFVIGTLVVALIVVVLISLPSFIDLSGLGLGKKTEEVKQEEQVVKEEDKEQYAILDKNKIFKDQNILNASFPKSKWNFVNSEEEMEKLIKEEKVKAGFNVDNDKEYVYYVHNKAMNDNALQEQFTSVLSKIYQKNAITEAGMDFNKIEQIYSTQIKSDVKVLGKDSSKNYFYAYILIFVLYMMILMYGQLIAVSVTSEKSNRAIEVLVTSTSSNSLIFGKVIAGAIASILQVGTVMASALIAYKVNSEAWNGMLDFIFKIPSEIILVFIFFGITGYLLYAFIYGALGALVSKAEEVGSSVGPITMVFVAVFFVSIFGLNNGESMMVKIASYVPFSSPMSMLTRVAMGNISFIEIVISYVILLATTILVGMGASKIYRMGTLMYGNPIKLKNAIKWLKKEKN